MQQRVHCAFVNYSSHRLVSKVEVPSITLDKSALDSYGDAEISLLLKHYETLYGYLGGDATKAHEEWRRLKLFVSRSDVLSSLPYLELYQHLFNQKSNKFLYGDDGTVKDTLDDQSFFNILLVVVIVMSYAVDTSVCERGFALMNNLKTAQRSRIRMRNLLLRILMTVCELGKDWSDPSKIPVEWKRSSRCGESTARSVATMSQPCGGRRGWRSQTRKLA